MKKILFLMVSLILTSCQDYDFGYSEREIAYESEFVHEFGKPQENHSWGFIQQPIIDYTETRVGVNPNQNEWADKYKLDVPQSVTDAEREYVTNWFATHQNPSSEVIHWENFFIQYVDCRYGNMDELQVKCIDGSTVHIYNYNNSTKAIQYVYNAGTDEWSYRSTQSTGIYNRQWDLFNIQHLVFTGSDGVEYDGWYIGFDYEYAKENAPGEANQFVWRDGNYNDWIVKVTPGLHQGYPITTRVMCEDLGNSYDWDFNDVVFDVTFTTEFATVVVRAVGGTLPIYIGINDPKYEAHRLIGDGSMTPIIHSDKVAIYTVEYDKSNPNANTIPIYVRGTEAAYIIQSSDIPQKFACPTTVEWAEECQNIRTKHTKFEDWVTDETVDIWNVELIN